MEKACSCTPTPNPHTHTKEIGRELHINDLCARLKCLHRCVCIRNLLFFNKILSTAATNTVNQIHLCAGFQAGPTFPTIPTFPYFFVMLLLFPTFL